MSRIHLNVKFPYENTQKLVMRLDRKSNKKDVLEQISEKLSDPSLKKAKIIVIKDKVTKFWFEKGATLKSLGVESDMTIIILRNKIRLKFDYNSKNFEATFSPSKAILDTIGIIAESASLIYYLGYSLFPFFKGKSIPISEDLPLCYQIRKFDKILFRIRYYPIMAKDTESGIPLSRTYSLTRDYILAGLSPLPRKDYITLCAKISVIESGDDLDGYMLAFNSAHFIRYLPEKMKTDLNSEDDLFDEIQLVEIKDTNQMRLDLICAARSLPTFGYQGFDVLYSTISSPALNTESDSKYVFLCVGYNGILFVNKSDYSVFEHIDLTDISFEISIDKGDQFIINDIHQITTSSDQILEIESLIKGYVYLYEKLTQIGKVDSKLESTIYNHTMKNDFNALDVMANPLIQIENQTNQYFFSRSLIEMKSIPTFNADAAKAFGHLYFVSSEKFPDFGDFTIQSGLNLKEKAKSLLDTFGIIFKEIRCITTTTYYDIALKYGNEMRSTVFLIHLMRKEGVDSAVCDKLMIVYRQLALELRTEVTIAKLKGSLDPPYAFPSDIFQHLLDLSNDILKISLVAQEEETSKGKNDIYKTVVLLCEEISETFSDLIEKDDELSLFEDTTKCFDLANRVSYLISIFAVFNPEISVDLSTMLMLFDILRIQSSMFPNIPANISALMSSLSCLVKDSYDYMKNTVDIQMKGRLGFIYDVINKLQMKIPLYSAHYIEKAVLIEFKDIVNQYYKDLKTLKIEQTQTGEFRHWTLFCSVLTTIWCIRLIPDSCTFSKKEDVKKKKNKNKSVHLKAPRIRLPKELKPNDEIELSTKAVDKLALKLSQTSDSTINLQDFIDELNAMAPHISSIIDLLNKWKPLLESSNQTDRLFDICKMNYEFGLRILMANALRQDRYQPPGLLLLKIQYHLDFVKTKGIEQFKNSLKDMTDRFDEFQMISKLQSMKNLMSDLQNVPKKTIHTESLILVLQKLINFLSNFKHQTYSVTQTLESINLTYHHGRAILVKLIHSQYDDQLCTIISTLIGRMRELFDIKKELLKKTMREKTGKKLTKKLTNIRRGMSGLSFYLTEKLMHEDGRQFLLSLSMSCWKISNSVIESNHHARLAAFLGEGAQLMKEMADILQDKLLTIQTIPQELINTLSFKSKEIVKYKDATEIDGVITDLTEVFNKRHFWDVSLQFDQLVTILESAIEKIIQKPYIHIFSDIFQPPPLEMELYLANNNNDNNDNNNSYNADSSNFSSSDSSPDLDECLSSSYDLQKVSRIKTMSNFALNFVSDGCIRVSRSDPTIANAQRPGILLDPTTTSNRKPCSPHVTFDLTKNKDKDKDAPIFSENKSNIIDDTLPSTVIPSLLNKRPNFISWNLPLFISRINIPVKTPVLKSKNTSATPAKRAPFKRSESFSHLNFDILRIRQFEEKPGFIYPNAEKADEDIEVLGVQCQNCQSRYMQMNNMPISDRVFFIIEWTSTLNSIPMKVTAARQMGIKQTETLVEIYNYMKQQIDLLVNELKIDDFQSPFSSMVQLMKLFKLTRFALQKAETDLMQIDLKMKDIATGWLIYTDEVIDAFQEMIDIDEPLVLYGLRNFLDIVFNAFVKFGTSADDIDKSTKRQFMTIIQCQLCLQLRTMLTNIKRMDLREASTIDQARLDIKSLKSQAQKIPKLEYLIDMLNEIESAMKKKFIFADADWYSLKLRHLLDKHLVDEAKKAYQIDVDAPIVAVFYQTLAVRYNLLNIRFTEPSIKTTFGSHVDHLFTDFDSVSAQFNAAADEKKTIFAKNIAQKWASFFSATEEELKEMASVSNVMLNSPYRLNLALKYLKKIVAQITKIESPHFPFEKTESYLSLTQDFLVTIDYVLQKMGNEGNKLRDISLEISSVYKVPNVKVTKFTNSYKSYFEKSETKRKGSTEPALFLKLLVNQLKAFSRKFGGSYLSIYDSIVTIAHSMTEAISAVGKQNFVDKIKAQNQIILLLRVKDDSPICIAEISILQKLTQIGELIVSLITYNLDFFLAKTSNSKDVVRLLSESGIKEKIPTCGTLFKNGLSYTDSINPVSQQMKIFCEIESVAQSIMEDQNPFNFNEKELEFISKVNIERTFLAVFSLQSVVKAHHHISQKFASLFYFTDNSKFIDELALFSRNATIYFSYFAAQNIVVLSEYSKIIVNTIHTLLQNINNLKEFRSYYFTVIDLMKFLKSLLDDLLRIEKEDSKNAKFDIIMEMLDKVFNKLSANKTKSVFSSLFDYVSNMKNMTRLKLRITYNLNDITNFVFSLKNLIECPDTFHLKNIKLVLQAIMNSFPEADKLCDDLVAYIQSCAD